MSDYTDAQLADGTTLRFQGDLSSDEVKQKVSDYRLKTGAGMQQNAQSQASSQLKSLVRPVGPLLLSDDPSIANPRKLSPRQISASSELTGMPGTSTDDLTDLGNTGAALGAIATGTEAMANPKIIPAIAKAALYGGTGSYVGGKIAGRPGAVIGGLVGSLAGGYQGYQGAENAEERAIQRGQLQMSKAREEMYNDLGDRHLPYEAPTDPYAPPSTQAMAKPLRPLVGTPEDWQAYDRQMSILRPEASDAGVYHAARGSASKKINLQQRIGRSLTK